MSPRTYKLLSWFWLAFAVYLHLDGGSSILVVGAVLISAILSSTGTILARLTPSHGREGAE